MAVRTTESAVGAIIDVDADIDLEPFIETANVLVTKHCVDTSFTAAELELIERWLSAHIYTVRDMIAMNERVGSVSAEYQSKVDLGFDSSHYGQMAMRLDWSGALAKLNEQIKKGRETGGPTITWGGTEEVDIDTDD